MPLFTRFKYIDLELIFSISSSVTTFAYRFGRNIWTSFSSESRIDSRRVDPYLVLTRLAWTIGYGLFIINEFIQIELLAMVAVASSKPLASSIVFVFKKKKKSISIHCTPPKAAVSLWRMCLKIRITPRMTIRGGSNLGGGECLKRTREWLHHPPAINSGRVQMAATVWKNP